MPHSHYFPTVIMLDHVAKLNPRRVLDVGVGLGKWGFLIRELLDFNDGRLDADSWQTEIVGIEAFDYKSPLHDWVYDRMIRADVRDVVTDLVGYDLVVMGDVIEHLEKDDGFALLRTLLQQNRNVLVSTPLHFFEQECAGNELERHLSHWTRNDFREWTYDYDVAGGAAIVVALAGRGSHSPTVKDRRASDVVYGLPIVRDRGAVARIAKRLVVGLPGLR